MLRSLLRIRNKWVSNIHTFQQKHAIEKFSKESAVSFNELIDGKNVEDAFDEISKEKSVLEQCKEDVSYIAPYLQPSFNFAPYVNKSETLQELLKLGVELHKLEKKEDIPPFILGLDFEKNIKKHVEFLHNLGLEIEEVGRFITRNPFIFKENLDDLETRIIYLKYKKFDDGMITRIIGKNPLWLQFSTQEIDEKLGFFQSRFTLTGDEVRYLTIRSPKIITFNKNHIKTNHFVLKEEMGFNDKELKKILLEKPVLFMKSRENLLKTFEFLHKNMKVPLETIAKVPEILTCREHKLKERYLFLQKLNRVQFDPKKPNYIALITLISGTDAYFATEIAKSSIQAYNEFLKSF